MGITDDPLKPKILIKLSHKAAALAIYPVSSRVEIKRYRIKRIGKKTITEPIPASIPSFIRDRAKSGRKPKLLFTKAGKISPKKESIKSLKGALKSKVALKTIHIMKKKIGIPVKGVVTNLSILSLNLY